MDRQIDRDSDTLSSNRDPEQAYFVNPDPDPGFW
jgi:hypothetical protein